ncbi:tetratricopeptide (TPR) repeat protein [Bradyrhizobium sp. USDA 4011]
MINAIISGEAGTCAVLSRLPIVYDLEGESVELSSNDLSGVFRGCTDTQKIKVKTTEEALGKCRALHNCDRALRFVLHVLDDPGEDRWELAQAADALLEAPDVFDYVIGCLYVDALPTTDSAQAACQDLHNFSRLKNLLEEVLRDQLLIGRVRKLFDAADNSEFESDAVYRRYREKIFKLAAQRELVCLVRDGKSIEFFLLQLNRKLLGISGARRAIETWAAPFRVQRKKLPQLVVEESLEDAEHSDRSSRSRGVFERITTQQAEIARRLKERDIENAQKFASELIRGQKSHSTTEQIAKSLSKLAQLAKTNGVPELQLEWARAAVECNPTDRITHSHLIDALIRQNRLYEASEAVDQAAKLHQGLFVLNARARILRARGDFEASRAMYLEGAEQFPHDPDYVVVRVGAAETLRDMGRYDEALLEYTRLTQEFPTDEVLWCGLASVHLDMGNFDKAIQNFGKALNREDSVARSGRATTYKQAGQFDQALRLYDQLLREFPNDIVVLCGRAEVFRVKGDLPSALSSYELAIERNPFSPEPVRGKFEVLREKGELVAAEQLLNSARVQFPHDPGLASLHAELLESKAAWHLALSAHEDVLKNFPRSVGARLGRARVLNRLGRLTDALTVYGALLAEQPYLTAATLGRASTLIEMGNLASAEDILRLPRAPKSIFEWRKHFLLASLYHARGDFKKSKNMFETGARKTPFVKIRRLHAAALARMSLRQGKPSEAVRVVDAQPNEISNVVRFHALAASGRTELARDAWSRITDRDPNIELATEIARRFRIDANPPQHDLDWIYRLEERALLREAA